MVDCKHLTNKHKKGALYNAAKDGHLQCVKKLIKEGANVNLYDRRICTVVMVSAMKGHEKCVNV